MNKQLLRWITILLPIGFLLMVTIISDLVAFGRLQMVELGVILVLGSFGAVAF